MTGAPAIYPSPAQHYRICEFAAPCLAVVQGADPEPLLAATFAGTQRSPTEAEIRSGDLGLWQGAAPPQW